MSAVSYGVLQTGKLHLGSQRAQRIEQREMTSKLSYSTLGPRPEIYLLMKTTQEIGLLGRGPAPKDLLFTK